MTDNTREQKLRQAAEQQGLIARKRVPPYRNSHPGWMLVDRRSDHVVAGAENGFGFELSLEQAEAFLADME